MKKISVTIILLLILSLVSSANAFANEDYYVFESFESKTSWTIKGTVSSNLSSTVSNAYSSEGIYSLYLTDNSTSEYNHNYSEYIDAVPGEKYKLLVDAYMLSGSIKAMIRYYNSNKTTLASHQMTMSGMENMWFTHSVESTAPANSAYMQVWVYTDKSQNGSGYFDNIRVVYNNSDLHAMTLDPPAQADAVNACIVAPSGDNLIYNSYNNSTGDKLSDFSYAGYYAGKICLPNSDNLTQFETILPSSSSAIDDTSRIQTIINNANAEYKSSGKVQVVTLSHGKYNINSSGLNLKSGVILRGEGQNPNGTVLYAYSATKHNVIKITGSSPSIASENAYITDLYIPSGSDKITIEADKVSDYSPGDLITIYHPNDDTWNIAMGMKGTNMTYSYPEGSDNYGTTTNTSWDPGEVDMKTERTIKEISGNVLTLDFPLFVPYDINYSKAYIYKTDDSGRITDVGIENLRIESYYDGTLYDENHAYIGICFSNAKNCYVRDVSTKYMWHSTVQCLSGSKQITIQNCSSLLPISKIEGSRRYTFYTGNNSQQILFSGCYSYDGRHDFSTSYQSTGPTVFTDCIADESNSESETHGTWSTGVLYDNIMQLGNASLGSLASINRGYYGTELSQGWSGAGVVMWNCLSNTIMAHKPPLTYQNFLVGQWGYYDDSEANSRKKGNIASAKTIYKTNDIQTGSAPDTAFATSDGTSFVGDAYKEAEFAPVEPRSLYKAQLALRITGSYKNTKPNSPSISIPRSDISLESNTVNIKGLYQKGADAVTVYIDDIPFTASLSTYSFNLSKTLDNGIHKIYATQTINGVEGNKSADRFITIKEINQHQSYLSSTYNESLTSALTEDTRFSYDEYEKRRDEFQIADIGTISYGDKIAIEIENSEDYSEFRYISSDDTILSISNDGIIAAKDTGTAEITVEVADKHGISFSDKVTVTVNKREISIKNIDFKTQTIDAYNTVADDKISFVIKYKLKEKGNEISTVTTEKIILEGKNTDKYICNSYLELQIPSYLIFPAGEGTEKNPYIIDNIYKFENVFSDFADTTLRTGKYYFLQTESLNIPYYAANNTDSFNGTYRGGTINEKGEIIYCNKTVNIFTGNYQYASLFGQTDSALIENIDIYGDITNSYQYTGAVAGLAVDTIINNCNNYASISSSSLYTGGIVGSITGSVLNCSNNADVSASTYCGGIAGATDGMIYNCTNYGKINSSTQYCGGISGFSRSNASIEKCLNHGNISAVYTAGGISGITYCDIKKSANFGNITSDTNGKNIGGIAGQSGKSGSVICIAECFNEGELSSFENVGGIVGIAFHNSYSGCGLEITDCYNAGNINATNSNTAGVALGINSANRGLIITNFYDIKNSLDIIGGNVSYVTSSNSISIPSPNISNSFVLNGNSYEYAIKLTANEIKKLISNEILSDSIWQINTSGNYTYPMLNFFDNKEFVTLNSDHHSNLLTIFSKKAGVLYIATYQDNVLENIKKYTFDNNSGISVDFSTEQIAFIWDDNLTPLTTPVSEK